MGGSYRVAVVGATGAVGQQMVACLEERRFPVAQLLPLASERSLGKKVTFLGKEIPVEVLNKDSFNGVEIALFSAGGSISKEFGPLAAAAGLICFNVAGELAPIHHAASAARFERTMLGHFVTQRRYVKHLAGFGYYRTGQRAMAGSTMVRRDMCLDMIGLCDLLQSVADVAFLSTRGFLAYLAQRLGLGFAQTVRGRWLAAVV